MHMLPFSNASSLVDNAYSMCVHNNNVCECSRNFDLKLFQLWNLSTKLNTKGAELLQFRISPHRPNVILGIENRVKKGLFP